MCIIVAKPAGVEMPSESILETCFENNPDGAGFMYAKDGAVTIEKGFMKYKEFRAAINKRGDMKDTAVVMHFRITTHGGTRASNTHPFPVSSDIKDLRALNINTQLGVAHNGVIPNTSSDSDTSDTMAYIVDVVAPLYRAVPNLIMNDDALDVIEATLHSKMALLDGQGELVTIGRFIEVGGVLYSNDSYQNIWGGGRRGGYYKYSYDYSYGYNDKDTDVISARELYDYGFDDGSWSDDTAELLEGLARQDAELASLLVDMPAPFDECYSCEECSSCAYSADWACTSEEEARYMQEIIKETSALATIELEDLIKDETREWNKSAVIPSLEG